MNKLSLSLTQISQHIDRMKDKAVWQTNLRALVDEALALLEDFGTASWYVVVFNGGEVLEIHKSKVEALSSCRDNVWQQICDFYRHDLPLKITPDVKRRFDLRLFQTFGEEELPFQEWADEHHAEIKADRMKHEEGHQLITRILDRYKVPDDMRDILRAEIRKHGMPE